ncbi:MAG: OB-fold nucleic acid binding domain-containing protein [Phycisphaerae bacterium]
MFLVLRDGTGLCQCVVARSPQTESFIEECRKLGQETSLRVTGTVRADAKQVGGHELTVTAVEVVSRAENYPITPSRTASTSSSSTATCISASPAVAHPPHPPHAGRRNPRLLQPQRLHAH